MALALQIRISHEIEVNLLDTYVGPVASRQILAGEIERDKGKRIRAAIIISDLGGFIEMTDRLPSEQVIAHLNDYIGIIATAWIPGCWPGDPLQSPRPHDQDLVTGGEVATVDPVLIEDFGSDVFENGNYLLWRFSHRQGGGVDLLKGVVELGIVDDDQRLAQRRRIARFERRVPLAV